MKTIIGAVCASLALMVLTPAQAWANPQHERMKRCNAEAKEQTLKGEERKAFMSTCLRGRHDGGAAKDASAVVAGVPAAVPAASVGEGLGEAVKAPVVAASSAAAATTLAPAPAAPAAVAPATVAATETAGADDKARAKACNQSATEQSLRGAKRKTFIAECLKG
ncbi:PsiF family protein [Thauera sp.]|uniref:PsiF family protein n=1 Tax=Thauera sp. TaxID=1905334 RepID=UPI002A35E53B|nr:PsiF family protein [Thauera sp.]MDX9884080.1 PsiF family protein [Thauera sp.]